MITRLTPWLLLCAACGAPGAPAPTGGTDQEAGACGRGFVVVNVDDGYQSTSVSLLDTEGAVLSALLISSGSAAAGLSAPLSGDVILPSQPRHGEELLLIDRYPASVLTWIGIATGQVRAQLDVRTGFAANPQDALVVDDRLFVSRYEKNPAPGQEPFDGGSDLLVVDPAAPAITGRIDLSPAVVDAEGFLARPTKLLRLEEGSVLALLAAYDAGFSDAAPARLAIIDPETETVTGHHVLDGLYNCNALIPLDDARIAVGCTGLFDSFTSVVADLRQSGIAVLRWEAGALVEERRWTGETLGGPVGQNLSAAGDLVLTVTFGEDAGDGFRPDRFVALNRTSGEVTVVRESDARPFVLGDVGCASAPKDACGGCFLTDAETGLLHHYVLGDDGLISDGEVDIDDGIGLPPRYLGRF